MIILTEPIGSTPRLQRLIDSRVDAPEEAPVRVLEADEYILVDRLGTTEDCDFSPFSDDTLIPRETALAKIKIRLEETKLAVEIIGE